MESIIHVKRYRFHAGTPHYINRRT